MLAVDPAVAVHEIQGNVLHGYGQALPHARHYAIAIHDAAAGRALLSDLWEHVTYADDWNDDPRTTALNVAISHRGLSALGVPAELLEAFPPEFVEGMAARAERRLGDVGPSAPATWQRGLGAIELLVIVHAADERALAERGRWMAERLRRSPGLGIDRVQRADALRGSREHFGFRDGFGQPAIREAPSANDRGQGIPGGRIRRGERGLAIGEFIHGYRDEDQQAAPVLPAPFTRNGTFMVYRKLAQDVVRFRRLVKALAAEYFNDDLELVEAKLAGRWRDGTPLILRPFTDPAAGALLAPDRNDFGYAGDPLGHVCPIGAHIRRANPRDSLYGGVDRTRRHRIIRRGMPYGAALAPGDGGRERDPSRGLVFVCFNASIARQFEVVNGWLNEGFAFGLGRDADLLTALGEQPETLRMSIQGEPPVLVEGAPLVWTLGGEYLLLPSRSALRALAEGVR